MMKTLRMSLAGVSLTAGLAVAGTPAISMERFSGERLEEKKALFGELHMHTAWSFDAYVFKTRSTPDEAFRSGKGEPLKHPLGKTYQLSRPLDFMAVTDHASYMGALVNMADGTHAYSKLALAQDVLSNDPAVSQKAYLKISNSMRSGPKLDQISDAEVQRETWERLIDVANQHNDPGRFTALIGYEYTASSEGRNLHRNVIFGGDTAPVPFSVLDSQNPEDLWRWMDKQRAGGTRVLAIPHNSNLSNGIMFDRVDSSGRPFTEDYAALRMRNEPLVEITQVKGTSETHPGLSPNDEFADFELVEQFVGRTIPITQFAGGYVRDALRQGLAFQDGRAFNPYRFGVIGSTDSHTGIIPVREDNYSGKVGTADGSPELRLSGNAALMDMSKFGASGLAAVWATHNTRDGVFSALERKESWATTGPRIQLRFFGGFDMGGIDPGDQGWVGKAYGAGVSMGGALKSADVSGAPRFVVWALKDVESVNLDRVQIIKGWSVNGTSHEKIYNVALSDGRSVDPTTGKAPAVGNTVDLDTLAYTNDIGAAQLSAVWTDPDFDASQNAFYYARVLEIPTPRWSTYDAKELGIDVPGDLPATLQERAFSSPIWFDVQ